MLRALLLAIALLPTAADAQPRPGTGLLSNSSPLPATIPLQVRTAAGLDYAIALTDRATANPVISGYLRGGEFFRLLVPPGDHAVNITAGSPDDWQGDQGFAHGQGVTIPLEFVIRAGRREGHQITVQIVEGAIRITDQRNQVICQIAEWDSTLQQDTTGRRTPLRYLDQTLTTRSRFCD